MNTTDRELQYLPVRHGVGEDVALAEAGVVLGAGPALVQPGYDAGVAEPGVEQGSFSSATINLWYCTHDNNRLGLDWR